MIVMMDDDEVDTLSAGYCVDCHHRGFVGGPSAGLNWNIECGNVDCRARYNVAWFAGRMQTAHRIPKRSEGGSEWPNEPKKNSH